MTNFSFWQKWLLIAGVAVSVFGILMAFLSGTPLFDLFNHQIDPAFWNTTAVDDTARRFQQWIYGVWGSTIAGWGIFLTYIARFPFDRKERWSWNCLVFGLLIWFVLDTSISLIHHVRFNVAFNTGLFTLLVLPLVFTRKEFI
jgi:hypothetical protein